MWRPWKRNNNSLCHPCLPTMVNLTRKNEEAGGAIICCSWQCHHKQPQKEWVWGFQVTWGTVGLAREGPSAEVIACVNILTLIYPLFFIHCFLSEAQERKGEEVSVDPKIQIMNTVYLQVPISRMMKKQQDIWFSSRCHGFTKESKEVSFNSYHLSNPLVPFSSPSLRVAQWQAELAKHHTEQPKIQQQFTDLKFVGFQATGGTVLLFLVYKLNFMSILERWVWNACRDWDIDKFHRNRSGSW